MSNFLIDGVVVNSDFDMPTEEAQQYVQMYCHKYNGVTDITLTEDKDGFINVKVETKKPFDRIRRITGYLVGTLDRFNNGKKAEEKDRVKHSI